MKKNFQFGNKGINYSVIYNSDNMITVLKDDEFGGEIVMQFIGDKYQNLTEQDIINKVINF